MRYSKQEQKVYIQQQIIMTYTLHKLSQGLFIVTSDEQTKEGDIFKHPVNILERASRDLDGRGLLKVIAQEPNIIFSALKEEEQKEIGWFDVGKLFYKDHPLTGVVEIDTRNQLRKIGYLEGFQKSQELLSDRRFTLEEVNYLIERCQELHPKYWENEIQSLSQKSWKVELEMEKETLYTDDGLDYKGNLIPKLTNGKIKILKLD